MIGVKKGWNTPNLPPHILKFHLHPIIRIARVIGWFATLSYLSGKIYKLPVFVLYITLFIIFINFLYFISFMQLPSAFGLRQTRN